MGARPAADGDRAGPKRLVWYARRLIASTSMRRKRHVLTACAWCERIELDAWVDEEEALRALRSFEWAKPPRFTQGICDDCLERLLRRREMGELEADAA